MTLSLTAQAPLCHYGECCILFIAMLSVIMLNIIMLSIVVLNAVMLSVVVPTEGKGSAKLTS
jgi:hypothetical protein